MMMPPWEAIAASLITAVTGAFVWVISPGQRRKDRAEARASEADAAESLTSSAREIVEMYREQGAMLSEQVKKERADKAELRALVDEVSARLGVVETQLVVALDRIAELEAENHGLRNP